MMLNFTHNSLLSKKNFTLNSIFGRENFTLNEFYLRKSIIISTFAAWNINMQHGRDNFQEKSISKVA